MLSRRGLVGKLAAGAAMVWAAGVARTSFASTRRHTDTPVGSGHGEAPLASAPKGLDPGPEVGSVPEVDAGPPEMPSAPPPWELLRPLALGSALTQGWRVADLSGPVDGSCVLTLQNQRGRAHRVHLCRNDGHPHGLVYTKRFDLVAMNGGQGDLPTEEGFARAVAEVAHVLAANEGDRRTEALVTALLPQAERLRRFSGPVDRKLR
jgi:hypothetical protein